MGVLVLKSAETLPVKGPSPFPWAWVKSHYHVFKVGFICHDVLGVFLEQNGADPSVLGEVLKYQTQWDLALLSSSDSRFSNSLGWTLGGAQVTLRLNASEFEPPPGKKLKILEGVNISPQALFRVYNGHSLGAVRTQEDWSRYLKQTRDSIYTAWHPATHKLEGYCILAGGNFSLPLVYEWGGEVSSLLILFSHILEKQVLLRSPQLLDVIAPPECGNLIRQVERYGGHSLRGNLALIRVVNPHSWAKKVQKGARYLGFKNFIFEFRKDKYIFGQGSDIYETRNDEDVVRLVFGPEKPEEIHKFKKSSLEVLGELFPIPFWVWGRDLL